MKNSSLYICQVTDSQPFQIMQHFYQIGIYISYYCRHFFSQNLNVACHCDPRAAIFLFFTFWLQIFFSEILCCCALHCDHRAATCRDGLSPSFAYDHPPASIWYNVVRVGICQCRQCKIFASGVNFSIFTHFLCFFLLKLLKLGENDSVKFLAWKSGGVKFLTNSMSDWRSVPLPCG